jgi:hypothetical protein
MVKYPLFNHEALSSNPSPVQKKKTGPTDLESLIPYASENMMVCLQPLLWMESTWIGLE